MFQKYGAVRTRTVRPSSKYAITFAKFPSQQAAAEALLRLHQLNVRGQYLTVEFAKKSMLLTAADSEVQFEENGKNEKKQESTNKAHFQAFLQKLNSWSMNQIFTQPPPPNIKYRYLPPSRSTLLRIAIQLIREPAFYTQVLHLMNRMNLPPPFEELETEFPMLREVYDMEKYGNIFGKEVLQQAESGCEDGTEEDESEIESDEENNPPKPVEIIPAKRKHAQSKKRMKIPKFVNPAKQIAVPASAQKTVRPEDMFEPVRRGETKHLKIELKSVEKLLNAPKTAEETESSNTTDGGFGLLFPSEKPEETGNKEDEQPAPQEVITSEELASNRISVNDQRVLPVFKNYHPGKPSYRLYIKNLAKQVEVKDLNFIYRKYVTPELKNAESEYGVRLMQEGRMKGQAFVTLQNVAQAQSALEETNGYILKNKPMVVQFAKVTKS